MKRPARFAEELEALIRVEMEEICAWPTGMAVSVRPEGETWKAVVMWEGPKSDDGRIEVVLQTIVDRLRAEYDLAS
jgi:hypothetical protein